VHTALRDTAVEADIDIAADNQTFEDVIFGAQEP